MMNHIEDILTLIKTAISSNISGKLTTIAAAYADGITLTAPKAYYINETYVLDPNFMPCIQIIPDFTQTQIPANVWDEDKDNIIIIAHNIAYDGRPETLAKVSYRYAKALSQIIQDNHVLGTTNYGWARDSVNYAAMVSDGNILKQQLLIKTNVLSIRMN